MKATALALIGLLVALVLVFPPPAAAQRRLKIFEMEGAEDVNRFVDRVRKIIPGVNVRAVPSQRAVIVYDLEERIAVIEKLVKRLDRPRRDYLIQVRTVRTSLTLDRILHLGFNFATGGGDLVALTSPRGRVELSDITSRSRGGNVQTVRVQEGGTASTFAGMQVPVVTTTTGGGGFSRQVTTMDAGKRLTIRAVRAIGDDAVELAVSTEDTRVVEISGRPASQGARTETSVQARLGESVILASLNEFSGNTTSGGGVDGLVQIEEQRSERTAPWKVRRFVRRSGGAAGWGRSRRRRGGTVLVVLTARLASRPPKR